MNAERALRTALRATIAVIALLETLPARAETTGNDPAPLSIIGSLEHDAGSAMSLIGLQLAVPFRFSGGPIVLIALLAAAILLAWPLRLWLLRRLTAFLNRSHHNTPLAVFATAMGAVVFTTILFALSAWLALFALSTTLTLLPEVTRLAQTSAVGVTIAGLGLGIGRALRSPDDKSRRPVQLPPGLGPTIAFYPFAAGVMLGVSAFVDQTSRILQATATSWTVAQSLVVIAQTILIGRFLVLAGQAREQQVATASSSGEQAAIPAIFSMTAIAWLALIVGCVAFILGETRFGALLVQELLWAALVLTLAWLCTRFLDALVMRLLDTDRRAGRFATGIVGVRQARVAQVAMLGSICLTVVVWIFALGLVAAPLHGDGAAVAEQVRPSPLRSALGSLSLSPRTIIIAIAVLVAGIALTRLFRNWLEKRFLPATSLDVGARSSVVTTLGYVGIIIAMLSAANVLGLQLEKITLLVSALSVGIGFGLQSIIQNFVSGLILLIERPVTLGDWVSVAGAEGTIRKIRVRATEIATADGGISIVPNSSFISTTVANRADKQMAQRVDVGLTLSGCGSADEARTVLLEMIGSSEAVRDDPAPGVFLRGLGDGSWTFDVRLYGQHHQTLQELRSETLLHLSRESERRKLKLTMA